MRITLELPDLMTVPQQNSATSVVLLTRPKKQFLATTSPILRPT